MFQKQQKFIFGIAIWILTVFLWLPQIAFAADGDGELVIFHTNDMHCRILTGDDKGKSIGLAEIAAAVKNSKAENPDTLWLDAGDTFHGMPLINIGKGEALVSLLNIAKIDAFVPGNHDFDYGVDRLKYLTTILKFPAISANVVSKAHPNKTIFAPYKIFSMPNGIKVGIFGLTTPETVYKTHPKNVEKIQFLNPVTVAKETVEQLRPKCDVLIGLTHLGIDKYSEFTSERIAREVSGIDLIVDGHSHTELPNGLTVGNTLIVQTGCYGHLLGKATLVLKNHRIESKNASLLNAAEVKKIAPKPDEEIVKSITTLQEENAKLFNKVVAKSEKKLSGDRAILRGRGAELGNLCADAFRWRTGADIAVIQGGGIRTDLSQGNVTQGDVIAIFPFGNTVQITEITGDVVRKMLERSVAAYPAPFAGFLQVSGLTFSFNPKKPAGSRVTDIYIDGKPLDEKRVYKLATSDFLLAGGDGYKMLAGRKIIGERGTCDEILADYLNKIGMKGIEPGRIKIQDK